MNKTINCALSLYLLSFLPIQAQQFNKENLQIIRENYEKLSERRELKTLEYLHETGESRFRSLGNGKTAYLQYVEDGIPYYISTHNLQARKTTGVEFVQSEQGLNLPLYGDNLTVGVWDGGLVRNTHVEFNGRVRNKFGSTFSNHATHVTGTIAAKGLNPLARGMAPGVNIIAYYAFENDISTITEQAANGLILSNHSYGLQLGWEFDNGSWKWNGGSENVDTRFGYYSGNSRSLDQIAYNAPNLMMVRSAGNDRSDVGDGTRPPDGPFDCLGPAAVAKNVITVGAITGFDSYESVGSAVMSPFSSWGPTDDGRIKPDIVADGVGVFSTSSSDDDAYTYMQGTSMSAPNVTGSLVLLQQFYHEKTNEFMTSAALKSLVIHTTLEAGNTPGPDYMFGWGVLNIPNGIKVLQGINNVDTLFSQETLVNGKEKRYELFSDGKTPIKATIAWTDVPGTPGAQGNTMNMLVNDLDIKLIDDEGNVTQPWVLNPANPGSSANRGDNVRDNVEQIIFASPVSRNYTIVVSHKNTLLNGSQAYGITITGGALRSINANDIYWVNASGGNLQDTKKWSFSSGGNTVPSVNLDSKSLVFDNNSQIDDNEQFEITNTLSVNNLIWLSDKKGTLNLNGNTLRVDHQILVKNSNLSIRNGILDFRSVDENELALNFKAADNCLILLNGDSEVNISTNINATALRIRSGNYFIKDKKINVNGLTTLPNASVNFSESSLTIKDSLSLAINTVDGVNNKWFFQGAYIEGQADFGIVNFENSNRIVGNFIASSIYLSGDLIVEGEIVVDSLTVNSGSGLAIEGMDTLTVTKELKIISSTESPVSIKGVLGKANILLEFREALCFDFLILDDIKFITESLINVGLNSELNNVENTVSIPCNNIIFPSFSFSSYCEKSLIQITNNSIGDIDNYIWDFDNSFFNEQINYSKAPIVIFNHPGIYNVTLTVGNDDNMLKYEKEIEIIPNDLQEINIIESGTRLAASLSTANYQWLRDGEIIEGETHRIIDPIKSGSYQVAYRMQSESSKCLSRVSEPFVIQLVTGTSSEQADISKEVMLYPNPIIKTIHIQAGESINSVEVFTSSGKTVFVANDILNTEYYLNFGDYPIGVYIIHVILQDDVYIRKVIKK